MNKDRRNETEVKRTERFVDLTMTFRPNTTEKQIRALGEKDGFKPNTCAWARSEWLLRKGEWSKKQKKQPYPIADPEAIRRAVEDIKSRR